MVCKVCGRTINNETANFCEYCGASFREMKMEQMPAQQQYVNPDPIYGQAPQMQQPYQAQMASGVNEGQEKPISFLNWLGTMLLPCIPFVGGIAYIAMLFIWAFGKETNKTKKNWARAALVVLAISIVLVIILICYFAGTVLSSGMTMEDYVNTYNTYY